MLLPVTSAFAGTAAEDYVKQASLLKPGHAAAVLTADLLGEPLPAGLSLELAKFLRDNSADADSDEAKANMAEFADAFVRSLVGTATNGPRTPQPRQKAAADLPAIPSVPVDPAQPVLPQLWNTYGLGVTLSWVVASYGAPDLAPWMLPGSARAIGTYTKSAVSPTVTTGTPFVPGLTAGVTVGTSYTLTAGTDIDALVLTALDSNVLTDAIAVHVPVSLQVAVTVTCTRATVFLGVSRCAVPTSTNPSMSTSTVTSMLDKVLATNATYTFGYPLNAGVFPTRATATDVLQVVYDALGTVWTQGPREKWLVSPFAGVGGLETLAPGTGVADLTTQAPPVSFFGMQTAVPASSSVNTVNTAFAALGLGNIPLRQSEPVALGAPLAAVKDWGMGPTAGYRVAEVRAGHNNLFVVRWHNLSTTTLGTFFDNLTALLGTAALPSLAATLPSAQATVYYDVPTGEYAFGEDRMDAQGAVYKVDWTVARDAPTLTVPPTLPQGSALLPVAKDAVCALSGVCL